MIVFDERRVRRDNVIYKRCSVYLFGVLVYRRWEQLTVRSDLRLAGEHPV